MNKYINIRLFAWFMVIILIAGLESCGKTRRMKVGEYAPEEELYIEADASPRSRDGKKGRQIYLGHFDMSVRPAWLSEKLLDYDDISDMSRKELRLLRNMIYAAHDRKFKSEDLQDYFAQFSWYTPLYDDDEISLNKIESANVKFILDHE